MYIIFTMFLSANKVIDVLFLPHCLFFKNWYLQRDVNYLITYATFFLDEKMLIVIFIPLFSISFPLSLILGSVHFCKKAE